MHGYSQFSFQIPVVDIEILSFFSHIAIDLFHNGGQIKYSFVLMLISLSNLVAMCKIQKNFCAEMRPVSLINIDTKE